MLAGAGRRVTIRSGEESVVCSTALLRRGLTSADSAPTFSPADCVQTQPVGLGMPA